MADLKIYQEQADELYEELRKRDLKMGVIYLLIFRFFENILVVDKEEAMKILNILHTLYDINEQKDYQSHIGED